MFVKASATPSGIPILLFNSLLVSAFLIESNLNLRMFAMLHQTLLIPLVLFAGRGIADLDVKGKVCLFFRHVC
jgi:hypothetical protein